MSANISSHAAAAAYAPSAAPAGVDAAAADGFDEALAVAQGLPAEAAGALAANALAPFGNAFDAVLGTITAVPIATAAAVWWRNREWSEAAARPGRRA
jgi:hypothetical protein